jgi:hypothetical protein
MSANVRVYLPSGEHCVVEVTQTSTLAEILSKTGIVWSNTYVFMNEGHTYMINHTMTLSDYNNWYVEKGFIPSLYIVDPNIV